MEQYLQEIIVTTDKGRHTIYIVAQIAEVGGSPRDFLAQVVSLIPQLQIFGNVMCLPSKYLDGEEALKAAFGWVQGYIRKNGEMVTQIDNPCNCPFVTKEAQQKVFSAAGISLPVRVNGQ